MKKIVIALGGNAIKQSSQKGSSDEQLENLRRSCSHMMKVVKRGYPIVITHGNGPQVGNLLIQQERSVREIPAQPLDVCDAMTQGQIGYMIQQTLMNELKDAGINRDVVTLVTQVMVDREDPGFLNPTKPIGSFYSKIKKEKYRRHRGHVFQRVEMKGGRYRRVVASPNPLQILEGNVIKNLFESGVIVIASGGGGVPVISDEDGRIRGIEAVVDKDLAGEKLAESVGADLFMILTEVDQVYLNFGKKEQKSLTTLRAEEAKTYLNEGQFPAGSMGPKIEACIRFIEYGGEKAIITCLECADDAFDGKGGTQIVP
jgi:carbamate kinase